MRAKKSREAKSAHKERTKQTRIKLSLSKGKIIILFVAVIFFVAGLTEIIYALYKIQHIETIPARVEVNKKIGFAVGQEGLNFGLVPRGGSSTREIVIVNQDTKEMRTRVLVHGSISKFLTPPESEFILGRNETKSLSFSVIIPENTKYGNYTGKISIIFERD
jgi:hypothetical protein